MSYDKQSTAVEQYFSSEFSYLIMREMRTLKMQRQEFADHVNISVETLDNWRNGTSVPRSDTLMKLFSKLSNEFVVDVIATAGIYDRLSIASTLAKRETGISIVANRSA